MSIDTPSHHRKTAASDASPTERDLEARDVAETISHLSRLIDHFAFAGGLTPAQWSALRYFSRANSMSRSPSAFAEYHNSTRGTASQTIKGLVAKGYLCRIAAGPDGRAARIDVTPDGAGRLERDPAVVLEKAMTNMPVEGKTALVAGLTGLQAQLEKDGVLPARFGRCSTCRHLSSASHAPGGDDTVACCMLTGAALTSRSLDLLCMNHSLSNQNRAEQSPESPD